jgi:hypothetical protein
VSSVGAAASDCAMCGQPHRGWHHSTRSSIEGNCVEAMRCGARVYLRDSKDPGPVLNVPIESFRAFVRATKAGSFG